jgi:hypothetical protein
MSLLMRAQTTSVTPVMRGIHPRVRSFAGLEFEGEGLRQRDGGGRARAGLESWHRHWAKVMIPWRCRLRKFAHNQSIGSDTEEGTARVLCFAGRFLDDGKCPSPAPTPTTWVRL